MERTQSKDYSAPARLQYELRGKTNFADGAGLFWPADAFSLNMKDRSTKSEAKRSNRF